jgi:hypothetical protein
MRERLPGGVFQPSQLSGWIVQWCEALESFHADGRVHGDLHPGCLMAEITGRLRILDLGIARPLAESVRLASMRSRYGALPFQSPQRREGGPVLRSDDLFAVGATLYDLLAGRPPAFDADQPVAKIAVQRAQLGLEGEPIPESWEEAIAACLASDPAARPESAAKLARRLGLAVASVPASVNITRPKSEPAGGNVRRMRSRWKPASRIAWTLFWLASLGSLVAVSRLAWMLSSQPKKASAPQSEPGAKSPAVPWYSSFLGNDAHKLLRLDQATPEPFEARSPGTLSRAELRRIGHRVWLNECAGTVEGLTSWNKGEAFASMGIGHFIWYPEKASGPFKESFPPLIAYLRERGSKIPVWAAGECPWQNREQFLEAFDSAEMKDLRELLRTTFDSQAEFLAARLARAVADLDTLQPAEFQLVQRRYQALAQTEAGMFAMIDYVNFKGEGTVPTERYHDHGWGLVQVFLAMKDLKNPVADFAAAAADVLEARVRNSPPERHEERWLPGWKSRVRAYAQ